MTLLSVLDSGLIDWSRAQFALTACYHWLFVPLTLGLALIVGIMETLYYVRHDEFWKTTAQFWMKLFGINFAIGVATRLTLFHPKNMTAMKVASMKNASIPSMAKGAPNMSPTNQE